MEQWLKVDSIGSVDGLVLAAPVTDAHGNVLVAAGAALTPSMLVSLQRRAIDEICVQAPEADADAPDGDAVRARLDKLFRKSGDSVAGSELRQRMVAYRLRSAS